MKAMIIMHLRDQMQNVIDEQGLPDVVFHVLFCFGYTNIGIEKCERLQNLFQEEIIHPQTSQDYRVKIKKKQRR